MHFLVVCLTQPIERQVSRFPNPASGVLSLCSQRVLSRNHEMIDYGPACKILARMKVFIVFAHAEPRNFNGAMFRTARDSRVCQRKFKLSAPAIFEDFLLSPAGPEIFLRLRSSSTAAPKNRAKSAHGASPICSTMQRQSRNPGCRG